MFGESSPDGPGLLGTQVKRQELLFLVDFPQCSLLVL